MSECKLSTYNSHTSGVHPRVKFRGKMIQHSHLIYAITRGIDVDDIKGKVIMHTCDNPACVNPEHLMLGTQKENVRDMWNKGRQGVKGMPGSKHPMAVLTEELVRQIKNNRQYTGKQLAAMYNVSPATVSMIKSGKIWKHVV